MTAMNGPANAEIAPVVLFDGVCNLCNSSVNFLIDRDTAGRLRFASLQSEAARRLPAACSASVESKFPKVTPTACCSWRAAVFTRSRLRRCARPDT